MIKLNRVMRNNRRKSSYNDSAAYLRRPSYSPHQAPVRLLVLIIVTGLTLGIFSSPSVDASSKLQKISADLAGQSDTGSAVEGTDGWWFLKEELLHVAAGKFWGENAAEVSRTKKKKFADPVPEIIQYNKKLKEKGITLYLMPVPPKTLIYPEKLQAGLSAESAAEDLDLYRKFYDKLQSSGVEVIDLLPTLLKNKDKESLYCKTDTHFSGRGLSYFAATAAGKIRNSSWYKDITKQEYSKEQQQVQINGDLIRMAGTSEEPEVLSLAIIRNKKTGDLVVSDKKSPVVLLGDSHTLVFSVGGDLHAKGAGLFDHLSAELGFPVDLLGVRGSGVTPARIKFYQRSKKDADYLKGKKALVWCFAARDFTGSGGWRDIPVAPK